jgi:hypothetical protein
MSRMIIVTQKEMDKTHMVSVYPATGRVSKKSKKCPVSIIETGRDWKVNSNG